MMAQECLIQTGYQQKGNVCVLASYFFVLDYYKKLETGKGFEIKTLFEIYEVYIRERFQEEINDQSSLFPLSKKLLSLGEKIKSVKEEAEEIQEESIQRLYEDYISRLFHFYCQQFRKEIEGQGISGYQHIKEFDEYLKEKHPSLRVPRIKILKRVSEKESILNAFKIIDDHLSESECNLAMALYICGATRYHSILISRDKDKTIIRDPENPLIIEDATIVESYKQQQIYEYILFSY